MANIINFENLKSFENYSNEKLINDFAKIHYENLPKSFYTTAGFKTVKLYYKLLFLNENLNILISQKENSNISGFVIWGSTNFSLLRTFLKNILKFNYAKDINIINFFKVEILKMILFKLFSTSYKYEPKFNSAQIISIAVDKNSQGKGIGSRLINQVLMDSKSKSFSTLQATTTSYQNSAVCFYNSLKNFVLVFEKKISNDYYIYVFSRDLK